MKWICHKDQVDPSGKKGWTVGDVTVKCTSQLPGLLVTDGSELSLSLEVVVCRRLSPILVAGGGGRSQWWINAEVQRPSLELNSGPL